ncbi:hypothetical protein PENDEC_c008G03570 [Penicillium decumbens]|uniref:Uncharacterized protein n=1 Tax=Penicillium decumbens TaxID=69771 RepID=A0A1V6PE06_PENDC|nr:hypothetical protein PENDEC_c008G03570 [Penicillium decumbens]
MKELTQKERAKFRAVWDGNLEICASCIPQDPAPRIDSHGTPIWKRYYALIGLQAATVFGFRIAAKVVGTTVLGAILAAINIDIKFARARHCPIEHAEAGYRITSLDDLKQRIDEATEAAIRADDLVKKLKA